MAERRQKTTDSSSEYSKCLWDEFAVMSGFVWGPAVIYWQGLCDNVSLCAISVQYEQSCPPCSTRWNKHWCSMCKLENGRGRKNKNPMAGTEVGMVWKIKWPWLFKSSADHFTRFILLLVKHFAITVGTRTSNESVISWEGIWISRFFTFFRHYLSALDVQTMTWPLSPDVFCLNAV